MSLPIRHTRGPGALVRALALAVCAVFVLAGCGGTASSETTEKTAASANFPVTLKHGHGSTKIPAKPKRVVAVSWMSLDVAAALGTTPVGVDEQWGGDKDGYTPWFRAQAKKNGDDLPTVLKYADSGEFDYEQILSLKPDLILGLYSGITETQYKRLSEIAPTVPYLKKAWDGGTWQEMTTTIGTALGEKDKAEALVTDVKGQLAQVAEEHPEFKGKTFTYGTALSSGATEVGLYTDYDARVRLLTEIGFENTPSMDSILSTVEGTNWYGGVSLEKLDTIEADLFVAWANGPKDVKYTLGDKVFGRWAPMAGKHYAFIQDPTLGMATSGPSVLSIPWALDRYVPMLADAVAGKGDDGS
ncbi:iron-siderophore ABC transporter substrate-binding protein [Streptomyces sp. NPDC047070]|uniref:iron-siderophore ABC transporter substrate-binding protein n=1 Tax=Streptomyces sp. NPDC047070 TaxID=3154923 RepID=UPI00345597E2